jgi:hypothetical protein
MKWLSVVLFVAALCGLGYFFRDQIQHQLSPDNKAPVSAPEPAAALSTPIPATPAPTAAVAPTPSKPPLKLEPGKFFAPPGVYYMTERVSVTTDDGVAALNVADQVKLVEKLPGNRMKVTDGRNTVIIKTSQATNDLVLARQAEAADFVAHGGTL